MRWTLARLLLTILLMSIMLAAIANPATWSYVAVYLITALLAVGSLVGWGVAEGRSKMFCKGFAIAFWSFRFFQVFTIDTFGQTELVREFIEWVIDSMELPENADMAKLMLEYFILILIGFLAGWASLVIYQLNDRRRLAELNAAMRQVGAAAQEPSLHREAADDDAVTLPITPPPARDA